MASLKSINPATEALIREYPEQSADEIDRRLSNAAAAFQEWRHVTFAQRGTMMHRLAAALRSRGEELSQLMTLEMGKPIEGAEAEVEKCAAACDWFADNAAKLLQTQSVGSDATRSYIRYEPLGAVLAIMPWNFPFWQAMRFAAPSLMAGNVGLLKHAPNVCGCALAIEQLFHEAGFPAGVFTTLLVDTPAVDGIIRHPAVAAVTLTGSERAGSAVASAAGREIKKTVLELGGSDPFIVLEDADVNRTASAAVSARTINSGQSCIAAKRFIVLEPIAQRFEKAMAERMATLRVGDPADRATEIGPMARLDLLENLAGQVRRSVEAGATLMTGGHRLPRKGYFYAPTVLSQVQPGMAAFDEETFGPVAAIARARDDEDAVRLANLSRFGLGASIWTRDVSRGERMASEIEAGNVFINGQVKSDPRLPFGGIKHSGYGRELSEAGIREFVNIKTVWVKEDEQDGSTRRSE